MNRLITKETLRNETILDFCSVKLNSFMIRVQYHHFICFILFSAKEIFHFLTY